MPRKSTKSRNLENPFIQSLVIPCVWRISPPSDQTEGRVVRSYLVDTEDNTQVYTTRTLELFKKLPSASMVLFMWICSKLPKNTDYIEINEEKYCAEMGISPRTFFTAKQGLLTTVIVTRESRANTYYVSPLYIYRGQRQKAYPDNVKVLNKDPLEQWLGKAAVSGDNLPIQPIGMDIPDLFGPANKEKIDVAITEAVATSGAS